VLLELFGVLEALVDVVAGVEVFEGAVDLVLECGWRNVLRLTVFGKAGFQALQPHGLHFSVFVANAGESAR